MEGDCSFAPCGPGCGFIGVVDLFATKTIASRRGGYIPPRMASSLAWLLPYAPFIGQALFAACLALGAALVTGGLFGVPRARAPVCSACGHGIASSSTAADVPCAECGRDLRGPRAIRYFETRRRGWLIVGGLLTAASSLLVIVALRLVMMLVNTGAHTLIGAQTPAADLAAIIIRTNEDNPDIVRQAVEESARRLATGAMDAEGRLAIVRAILDRRPESPQSYVSPEQDHLIRSAHADGVITNDAFVAYLQARVGVPTIDLPSHVRVPARRFLAIDTAYASQLIAERRLQEAIFTPDGATGQGTPIPVPIVDHADQPLAIVPPNGHAFLRFPDNPAKGTLTLTIEENFLLPGLPPAAPTATSIAVAARRVSMPLQCEPTSAPTWIGLESPAARREEVRRACSVRAVAIDDDAEGRTRSVRIDAHLGPVEGLTLAFDIVVQIGEREVVAGRRIVHRKDGSTRSSGALPGMPSLPITSEPLPARVSVLFRPVPAAAEDLPGVTAIWGETITVDDVPLERSIAPQPSAEGARP